MSRSYRYKKRRSDLSGFDYLEHEMIKENGIWIGPDERDDPPPSKLSLGGEGDISLGSYFRDSTSTAVTYENPTFYITASGITPVTNHPYMRVTGSNGTVTLATTSQIAVGREGQVLTLFCTEFPIVFSNGSGISLMGSQNLILTSGAVAVFMYNTANNAWNETSRVSSDFGIGG